MSHASRSRIGGFTLVELLVALVIFTLVATSLYNVLNVSQRVSRTQAERGVLQGSLRTGIQLAVAELQEIWTDDIENASAITAMTPTSLSYRGMRGLGLTCGAQTATTIVVNNWTGLSVPSTGQGVYVYDIGTDDDENDDSWREGTITGVATGTCDGITSYTLTVSSLTAGVSGASMATVPVPGPVRTYEAMQFGLVTSGGRNWLGLGVAGGALTPLAGPLNSTGLLIEYKAANGSTTTDPAEVKSIVLRLYGETDRAANAVLSGATRILGDTVQVRVQLRNSR